MPESQGSGCGGFITGSGLLLNVNARPLTAKEKPSRIASNTWMKYEDGPWDGVEGAKYLYKEVLAAL